MGRHDELALIDAYLSGAAPPTLFFAGEPGIGKSRLLAEAAHVAREQGWEVLAGGCVRQQGQEPFEPLVSALARHISQMAHARQRVLLQGCAWLVRLLPELAEQHVVPAPTWTLPPPQERRLMFAAVARYLANVAGPAGTLLLLDDLQWAGSDAIALLASLVAVERDEEAPPLRLIGAYRSTEVPPEHPLGLLLSDLAKEALVIQRALPLLTLEESIQVFDQAWSERAPGEQFSATALAEICDEVVARADGLPFFVVSSVRALQSGADPRDLGTASDPAAQSVHARVAVLPTAVRELLGLAAVVGRRAPGRLLLAASDTSERMTLNLLDTACQAGLLVEEGDGSYRFAHDLIRDVIEMDLGALWTRALHGRVAEEMARPLPDGPKYSPADIAYHFHAADERRRAMPYALQAGSQAMAVLAYADAERHLVLAAEIASAIDDHDQLALAITDLLDSYHFNGRVDEGFTYLLDLMVALTPEEGPAPVGRSPDDAALSRRLVRAQSKLSARASARLNTVLTMYFVELHDIHRAVEASERAIASAQELNDVPALCHAYYMSARTHVQAGNAEATLIAAREAERLARQTGHVNRIIGALSTAANVNLCRGDFHRALELEYETLPLIDQLGMSTMQSLYLAGEAEYALISGDWAQARVYAEKALEEGRDSESSGCTNPYLMELSGRLLLLRGGHEKGLATLHAALGQGTGKVKSQALTPAAGSLAEYYLVMGEPQRAYDVLEPHLHLAHSIEDNVGWLLVWAYVETGRVERADQLLDALMAHAQAEGLRMRLNDLHRVLGILRMKQQRAAEVAAALEEALTLARDIPYPYAEAKALYVYGQLHETAGDPERAREAYQRALTICARLGERMYAEHIERALAGL